VVMDSETVETLVGWSGCCGWPAGLGPCRRREGPRSRRHLVALGTDLVAGRYGPVARRCRCVGPTPIAKDEGGLLRSAEQLRPRSPLSQRRGTWLGLGCGWRIWWGSEHP
jgi:hypothetical protein